MDMADAEPDCAAAVARPATLFLFDILARGKRDLESVVAKRLDSQYLTGRSDAWLKIRAATARPQERR